MSLARTEHPPDRVPETLPTRSLQPENKIGVRQSEIETDLCEVSVTDPAWRLMVDCQLPAEFRNIYICSLLRPQGIQANIRRAQSLAKPPGGMRFARACAAKQDHAIDSAAVQPVPLVHKKGRLPEEPPSNHDMRDLRCRPPLERPSGQVPQPCSLPPDHSRRPGRSARRRPC